MKLIDDIIEIATEDKEPISNLLRKCLVLAYTLKNEKLKAWVEKELDGYDLDNDELPPYRVTRAHAKGVLLGPFQGIIKDQPLSSHVMEKDHRHWAEEARLNAPIAAYEAIAVSDDKGNPIIPWPASLVAYYQEKFVEGWALNRAWIEIPRPFVESLVDSVRNRILRFALELREELGTEDDPQTLPSVKVDQQVVNIIYGGNNIIASSAETISQANSITVTQNDIASLVEALKSIGFAEDEVKQLETAIDKDSSTHSSPAMGERVKRWIKGVGSTVGKQGLKVGAEVAQRLATAWLMQYYGLNS